LSAHELGHGAEAIEIFQHVYDQRFTTMGPRHPDTLVALQNLSAGLWKHGREDEATTRYLQALRALQIVLGAQHPETKALEAMLVSMDVPINQPASVDV